MLFTQNFTLLCGTEEEWIFEKGDYLLDSTKTKWTYQCHLYKATQNVIILFWRKQLLQVTIKCYLYVYDGKQFVQVTINYYLYICNRLTQGKKNNDVFFRVYWSKFSKAIIKHQLCKVGKKKGAAKFCHGVHLNSNTMLVPWLKAIVSFLM